MKSPHVVWASVVIVALMLASTVLLTLYDKNTGTILAITASTAIPLLSAFGAAGWQVLQQVKTQGNGTLTKILEQNRELLELLKSAKNGGGSD